MSEHGTAKACYLLGPKCKVCHVYRLIEVLNGMHCQSLCYACMCMLPGCLGISKCALKHIFSKELLLYCTCQEASCPVRLYG